MNHANIYVVGLALCTFANIASEEMSRDLANEVEKLLGSSNTYIRKKVGVCSDEIIPLDYFQLTLIFWTPRPHYVLCASSAKFQT
jgi:hypothetical protein